MKRITIERYKYDPDIPLNEQDWHGYSGLIEGETDSGRRWVIWLDHDGTPEVFWPDREEDGAVVGEGTWLIPADEGLQGKFAEQFATLATEVGDGEPTELQYRALRRLAYTDRTISFKDDFDAAGIRTVTIYNRRWADIRGQGTDTGQAYWAYHRALAATDAVARDKSTRQTGPSITLTAEDYLGQT